MSIISAIPYTEGVILKNEAAQLRGRAMNNTLINQSNKETIPEVLPIIPTMDVVVFPNMIVPLLVLDEKNIKGVNHALQE